MSGLQRFDLAPVGSTGNNSHAGMQPHVSGSKIAVEFNVEAIGATPTVTFALQGAMNDSPGANDWQPILLLPPDSDTPVANKVVTAVGRSVLFVAQSHVRFFKQFRLVTSANTNVTYSAKLAQLMGGL